MPRTQGSSEHESTARAHEATKKEYERVRGQREYAVPNGEGRVKGVCELSLAVLGARSVCVGCGLWAVGYMGFGVCVLCERN